MGSDPIANRGLTPLNSRYCRHERRELRLHSLLVADDDERHAALVEILARRLAHVLRRHREHAPNVAREVVLAEPSRERILLGMDLSLAQRD